MNVYKSYIVKMNIVQWIVLSVILQTYCVTSSDNISLTTLSAAQHSLINYVNKFAYSYNPKVGYEPYWADGDRVLHDDTIIVMGSGASVKPPPTTTKSPYPKVCGTPCLENYRGIKHVCTHHTSNNKMRGCMFHPLSSDYYKQHCWNIKPDTFVDPFKEFDTYCEFLQATCKAHFTTPKYILLHLGKCKDEHFWFKPLQDSQDVIKRFSEYPLLLRSVGFKFGRQKKRRPPSG